MESDGGSIAPPCSGVDLELYLSRKSFDGFQIVFLRIGTGVFQTNMRSSKKKNRKLVKHEIFGI
jgi:hypothetical protein